MNKDFIGIDEMEELQFELEMIIVSRNENGATLSEIEGDYTKYFGVTFESIFGYKWSEYLSGLLTNSMNNIFTRIIPRGHFGHCTLFFMNLDAFKEKLLSKDKNEKIQSILKQLNIDPENIKPFRSEKAENENRNVPSSTNSSNSLKSSSSLMVFEFYNHTLIGDDFFLELAYIDLQQDKCKKQQIEYIGWCISGQTLKSAHRKITYSTIEIPTKKVILNIGTFDLLNGRSIGDMIADIVRLLNAIRIKNLIPILTTLAPIANHLDGELEEKRKMFNKFLRDEFDFIIDIEKCFLSNENRILLECYQPLEKNISGNKQPLTLWNRIGRQRVLQLMKQEIPYFQLSLKK